MTPFLSFLFSFSLTSIDDQVDCAFVYGSVAKRTDTASSDIDLLVVSDSLAYSDLMGVLNEAEQSLGRPINPSIYNYKQIKEKIHSENAFILKVMEQPKLWIKGTEDVIGKFG